MAEMAGHFDRVGCIFEKRPSESGFNFVETVLSDGLCLISNGKGGDCLWANVFQLSAF